MSDARPRILVPDQWVTNYADLLFRYLYLRLGDRALAEDIVQETFLSAWRSRETYNQSSSEKNWLFAICKNKLIDHYRKLKSNRTEQLNNTESYYFDENDHWTVEAAPRIWTMPGSPNGNQEFFQVLDRCRNKLNKTQHAVFSMRYIDEVDAREICRVLGITNQNYWVLIHRAKLQLRECLQRNWIDL